jgi:membrane fusion protein, multidrug efflux system
MHSPTDPPHHAPADAPESAPPEATDAIPADAGTPDATLAASPPGRPKPSALAQALRYTLRLLILAASFGGAWLWVGPDLQDALSGRARPKPSADAKGGKKAPLVVEVDTARRVSLPIFAQGTGTIRARQKVDIVSERARRLVKLHVRSGQQVNQGDPLFTLDAADLRARLSTLRSQLSPAQTHLTRTQTLAKSGAAPQADLDAALARLDEIKRSIAEVQVELDRTTLSAPFTGTIGLIDLTEGALLQPSQRITTLYDVSALEIDVLLPERYAALIQRGQPLTAHIAGREGDVRGHVLVIEPTIDRATRSVSLRASLDDLSGGFDGAFASVSVEVQASDALLISSLAVVPGLEGRQVFRVIDGVAKATPVTLGDRSPTHIQVLSGLSEGDAVAVSNLLRLRDGAAVTLKAPPVAPSPPTDTPDTLINAPSAPAATPSAPAATPSAPAATPSAPAATPSTLGASNPLRGEPNPLRGEPNPLRGEPNPLRGEPKTPVGAPKPPVGAPKPPVGAPKPPVGAMKHGGSL